MTGIYIAAEDALSEAVAERIIRDAHIDFQIVSRIGRKGNAYLKSRTPEFVKLARHLPVLLITDLDMITCPVALIDSWFTGRTLPEKLLFRIAVREIEAWILADKRGFSKFSGIPLEKITDQPESLVDPKQTLLNLVRRFGYKEIKQELLPRRNSTAKIGIGYNDILCHFTKQHWSINAAAKHSESLMRACERIRQIHSIL